MYSSLSETFNETHNRTYGESMGIMLFVSMSTQASAMSEMEENVRWKLRIMVIDRQSSQNQWKSCV